MWLSLAIIAILAISSIEVTSLSNDVNEEILVNEISQVSLHINGKHHASGVVIHPNFVLTSWSSIKWISPSLITVVPVFGDKTSVSHGIKSINYTYNYDEEIPKKGLVRPIRDLALIQINGTIGSAKESIIQPASLVNQGYQPPAGALAQIPGFDANDDLEEDDLPLVDRETCNKIYQGQGGVQEGQICVRGDAQLSDTDRGTPLFISGLVAGIATWSLNGNSTDYPAIFTNVGDHVQWINATMKYMLGEDLPWFDFSWEDHWVSRLFTKYITRGEVICRVGPRRERITNSDCSAGCRDKFHLFGHCDGNECKCRDWYLMRPIYDMLQEKSNRV